MLKTIKALAKVFPSDTEVGPLMRFIVNQSATARGLTPPWDASGIPAEKAVAAVNLLTDAGNLAAWGAFEFGSVYENVISAQKKERLGANYTPPDVAEFMVRFTIGPQLDRLAAHPDPGNLLQVLALDPSCGAGIFLVSAGRLIARRYAGLIGRTDEPTDWMIRRVMPEVMSECVFGIDIDPIAVELAKSACWLEMSGTQPISFMDRNIICGDPLANDSPPKLDERYPHVDLLEEAAS